MGGFWKSGSEKFRETKLRLQLDNFTQKLDLDVLQFRRRRAYKIQEKKKEKKGKKKTSSRLKVGW